MTTTVTCETHDLRAALTSVAGHASRFTDDVVLRRIRLTFDRHNVYVTATNRYSAALAIASVWDDGELDDDHLAVDLTPSDVGQLLAVFAGRPGKDGEVGDTVRLDLDVENLTVTDTGGLFEGKRLTLPRLPMHEHFPNVARLIRVALGRETTPGDDGTIAPVWADARLLALFRTAGSTYGERLILEPTGDGVTSIVVRCGESFLGLLMPVRPVDEDDERAKRWRNGWLSRLSAPATDPDTVRAWSWLRDGHGVTVSWEQTDGVSIGEGMRAAEREQLAAAVRLVVERQECAPSLLKKELRVRVADARALLEQLVTLGVIERSGDPAELPLVVVEPDGLALCLEELGLADAPQPVPAS